MNRSTRALVSGITALSLLAPAAISVLAPATVLAATNVVVTPGNMQGWSFVNDNAGGTGTGTFVWGPSTAPVGSGSAQLTTANASDGQILTEAFPTTLLSSLTNLSYSTYQSPANP